MSKFTYHLCEDRVAKGNVFIPVADGGEAAVEGGEALVDVDALLPPLRAELGAGRVRLRPGQVDEGDPSLGRLARLWIAVSEGDSEHRVAPRTGGEFKKVNEIDWFS